MSGRCGALPFVSLLALAGAGCASREYVVRSDHFRVTVPRTWEVVRVPGPGDGPAIVRVPAARDQPGGTDTAFELHFYPWLVREPIGQPTQEAFRRLVGDGELDLKSAAPADASHCRSLVDHLSMLGALRSVMHVETPSGDHIVLVAGQSEGSLIAVAAVVPGGAHSCRNVMAAQDTMDSLASMLEGVDVSDRPPPPVAVFAPVGNIPGPELPPSTSMKP